MHKNQAGSGDPDPGAHLPAGKAGLTVGTLRVTGLVRAASGMIAVVADPQSHVYFLHEGDQVHDGRLVKIALDDVVFQQDTTDHFGRRVERQVVKRLHAASGAEQ